MSTNTRRNTHSPANKKPKRPLTLEEQDAELRQQIYILENRVGTADPRALRPTAAEAVSNRDTWTRQKQRPTGRKVLPTSAKARQTRERTSVLIELAFSTVLLLGAALWLWQRFGK